jgi:outer membrane protein assembly factor BamB
MKHLAGALAALLMASAATAQDRSHLHTHPAVPSDDAMRRLNLELGWRTYVSVDGRRDAIYSVQNAGDVLLVQTRSGLVCAVEAETGRVRWQSRVGRPYHVSVRLGYTSHAVYVVNDQTLYVLDRDTGALLWDFDMPSAVTTAPVADEEQVFLSLYGGTVSAYSDPKRIPKAVAKSTDSSRKDEEKRKEEAKSAEYASSSGVRTSAAVGGGLRVSSGGSGVGLTSSIGALASATGKGTRAISNIGPLSSARQTTGGTATSGVEPRLDWSDASGMRLEVTPLQTSDTIFLVGAGGRIAGLEKGLHQGVRYHHAIADDLIIVAPGQHGEVAYVASQDSNLYAVRIVNGGIDWRFTTGTPITYRPAVTDDDVYITTSGGLRRLDRRTGQAVWHNRTADRFVAANPKVVYATDRSGHLLLLDRARGTQVGSYDAREFVVPVANDLTDRVYLAAHDGLLVCLHDRDHAKPHVNKKWDLTKPGDKKRGDKLKEKPKPRPAPEAKEPGDEKDKGEGMDKKQ